MCETIRSSHLAIDMDAPADELHGNPAIAFKIAIALAVLHFLAAVMFGALPVLFCDAVSLVAFFALSFAVRA